MQKIWDRISNSHPFFPLELRQCFHLFREKLAKRNEENLSDKLVSASIFLRFLCPAILSPSLFNITQEYPNEKVSRNLTLIAKTLQTLANFTMFQGKENYMEFLNEFIRNKQPEMKVFLNQISSGIGHDHRGSEFDGDIDLGSHLSMLHVLLREALNNRSNSTNQNKKNPDHQHYVDQLKYILDDLDYKMNQPNVDIMHRLSSCSNGVTNLNSATTIEQKKAEEHRGIYQSLQRNIFRYNDPTITNNYHQSNGVTDYQAINGCQMDTPQTPRSSTLPRTSYLVGSARKPARDLGTADDYVLISALEPDDRQRAPHPIVHSYSHSHIATGTHPGAPVTPLHNHHQHFHNHHASWFHNRPGANMHPHGHGHKQSIHNGSITNGDDHLDVSHEENDRNSSGDQETNMKGSQTSISQLSNVASSGYQSFAYSQSSSPVDPVINHHDSNNNNPSNNNSNTSDHNHLIHTNSNSSNSRSESISTSIPSHVSPLAFNNPMYHLHTTSSPQPVPHSHHIHNHHISQSNQQQQSPVSSSLSSAHSVEDLPLRSNGSFSSSRCPQRAQSTSSEGSTSLTCTPPAEHRYPPFKSGAPRTNPHCIPPTWGHSHNLPGNTPDHHHSTSDLLSSQCRRTKNARRQSAELANNRRLQRQCESDSSSDDQMPQPQTRRHARSHVNHHRGSDTKTLEEVTLFFQLYFFFSFNLFFI